MLESNTLIDKNVCAVPIKIGFCDLLYIVLYKYKGMCVFVLNSPYLIILVVNRDKINGINTQNQVVSLK